VAASDAILRPSTKLLRRRRGDPGVTAGGRFYGVNQSAWLVTQNSVAIRAAEQATTTG
jgi:hypothetical protein